MRRVMEIKTPLGADVLLFHRMTGHEDLGKLGKYEIKLLSKQGDVDHDKILAKSVTVMLELPGDKLRYYDGYVTRFAQAGTYGSYYIYQATIHPWLWFLTRTVNCRIFQESSVPDIIKKIFADYQSVADFKLELTGSYRTWDYCVQYRESDFNFVSRLMEQEGIYYYFSHSEGKHTLILTDSYSGHAPYPGYAQLPYIPHDRQLQQDIERIHAWGFAREVQPGRFTLDDYDFTKPSVELQVKSKHKRTHDLADYEMYEYPGEYSQRVDGESYVQTRLDERQSQFEVATGSSHNARGICCGAVFKLSGHHREDQNREFLITSTTQTLDYNQYEASETGSISYACSFSVMSTAQAFRPWRATAKPTVQGPQTAMVVGPAGDEIYTDKYGRVKVQFHWDRQGKSDQDSSCWVRVSQNWAGKRWGAIFLPRIGQEVIVDFLEGDPDQPIITGRVYNAEQMPPYNLPGDMTRSTIKSNSSKGGGGFNELRFEDKKGQEEVYIHGEKDWTIVIKHDKKEKIGHDESCEIGRNVTVRVGGNVKETITGTQTVQAKEILLEGTSRIVLKSGGSTIEISPAGIVVKGPMIDLNM